MPIVAIIGLDGSGKTTQAGLLTKKLQASGAAATCVRADYVLVELLSSRLRLSLDRLLPSPRQERAGPATPSRDGGKRGSAVRRLFLSVFGYPYALISYAVLAFRARGKRVVVCDRYFYQFFYDVYGAGAGRVARLFPKPRVAYFLDGSLELFRARMTNPFDRAVSSRYYAEVHSLLQKMSRNNGFVAVDAAQEAAEISDFIFNDLWGKLKAQRQARS